MTFFTSEYECKMDTKGRLMLPSKIKVNLPEVSTGELVLRKGFESSVIIYPMVEYKRLHNRIITLSEFNPEQRKLKRNFFRSIAQVELDNSGRILIPKQMLLHAKIEKEVVIVGMGNYLEMWSREVLDQQMLGDINEFSALAQKYLDEG